MSDLLPAYQPTVKVKDQKFDIEKIAGYALYLQLSETDFELCIVDTQSNRCLLVERYQFKNVLRQSQVIDVLEKIYDEHHLLQAGFWKKIKLGIKNHKFSLVPKSLFDKNHLDKFLQLNCKVDPQQESALFQKQDSIEAVNIFSAEKRVVDWFTAKYPAKEIELFHETGSFIEGVMNSHMTNAGRGMYIYIERQHMLILVSKGRELEYSNVFNFTTSEDLAYYALFVFHQMDLDPDTAKLVVWGEVDEHSSHYLQLSKYVRNIETGERPSNLKFSFVFDEIEDHRFFSLYNMHLCE